MQFNLKYANDNVRKKLELYRLAVDLFSEGKSYPQILKTLKEREPDTNLLEYLTSKAMYDEWKKIEIESKKMLDEGVPLVEIKEKLIEKYKDEEIVDFICEQWYGLKIGETALKSISGDLLEKSFQQLIYGGIMFLLVYQISTKWYALIIPSVLLGIGVYGITISIYTKIVSVLIHKVNNEQNK